MTKIISKNAFIGNLEEYRQVFEEIDVVIIIIDMNGRIDYVNRYLRKFLGEENKRFTGTNIADSRLFQESLSRKDILNILFNQKEFLTHSKDKHGNLLHLAWKTKAFNHQGRKKILAIVRDMSSLINLRKKIEYYNENLQEEVLKRTQELEKEKQKAVDLHRAKAIFLSKLSHEIRTPLTAITGYTDLIKEGNLSAEQQSKYLSIINRNARSLLDMVNETLNMIQIEQDKYQIKEQIFDLESVIFDVFETYSVMAREKGLDFDFEISPEVPKELYSDPQAIRQILINLVTNALKFTNQGGVKLKVVQRSIPHKGSKRLYFYVEDTGVGIPKEYRKKIFGHFEQYLDSDAVYARGSGLGLSICKQLAKLLGGDVKLINSEKNLGSVFVFTLPIRRKLKLTQS